MPEPHWTIAMVEAGLADAGATLKQLPEAHGPRGYFSSWPQILHEFSDLVEQEPPRFTRITPSAQAITRMEETWQWLNWLEPQERKVVWLRAAGVPWKMVCHRVGLCRANAYLHHVYAFCVLALRLNGKPVNTKISRQRLIERVRAAEQAQQAA